MSGLDAGALDRYITGNYGADQWADSVPCAVHGFDCDADQDDCEPVEDDRDFDSMPGGWDYEAPEDDVDWDGYPEY